jgi:hypothetical protein
VVFQDWLHESRSPRFIASHLSYASRTRHQRQTTVKVPGSFRPTAGRPHLHSHCNFAESLVETAPKSLRHSCRSELTRQGISLRQLLRSSESSHFSRSNGLSLHKLSLSTSPQSSDHLFFSSFEKAGVWSLRILEIEASSFLLIFRTRRVVTVCNSQTSSAGYTGFPAYSRLRTTSSPMRGAAPLPARGIPP